MNLVERIDALSDQQREQILSKTKEDMDVIIRKAKGGEDE